MDSWDGFLFVRQLRGDTGGNGFGERVSWFHVVVVALDGGMSTKFKPENADSPRTCNGTPRRH
jgi:hypothetical protein